MFRQRLREQDGTAGGTSVTFILSRQIYVRRMKVAGVLGGCFSRVECVLRCAVGLCWSGEVGRGFESEGLEDIL